VPRDPEIGITIKANGAQAGAALKDVRGQVSGLGDSLGNLSTMWKVALGAGAVLAIRRAAGEVYQLGKAGARISELSDAFHSVVPAAEDMLAALNEASSGTISNADLMLTANRAAMLGVSKDVDEMSQLMEIARFRARAMGLDTTQAFNDIVTGIGRASPMILDNLGIVVDSEAAYAEYASSLGKASDALTDAEKKQALLNDVLSVGADQIREAGGVTDSAADSYRQFESSLENIKQYISEIIAMSTQGLISGAGGGAGGLEGFLGRAASDMRTADQLKQQMDGLSGALKEIDRRGEDAWQASNKLFQAYHDGAMTAAEVEQANADYVESIKLQERAHTELRPELASIQGEMHNLGLAVQSGRMSVEEYDAAMANLQTRLDDLSKTIQALGGGGSNKFMLGFGEFIPTGVGATDEAVAMAQRHGQMVAGVKDTAVQMAEAWYSYYQDAKAVQEKLPEDAEDTARRIEQAYNEHLAAVQGGFDRLSSSLSSVMQPTQSFDYDAILDKLGYHRDTWDEEARRMMDVVNRGAESPWAQHGMEQGFLSGEGDIRKEAADWMNQFYQGMHPEDIKSDALATALKESLAKENLAESFLENFGIQIEEEQDKVALAGQRFTDWFIQAALKQGNESDFMGQFVDILVPKVAAEIDAQNRNAQPVETY